MKQHLQYVTPRITFLQTARISQNLEYLVCFLQTPNKINKQHLKRLKTLHFSKQVDFCRLSSARGELQDLRRSLLVGFGHWEQRVGRSSRVPYDEQQKSFVFQIVSWQRLFESPRTTDKPFKKQYTKVLVGYP